MDRRDALRLLSLSALAISASPVLVACGSKSAQPAPGPAPRATPGTVTGPLGDVRTTEDGAGIQLVSADLERDIGRADAVPDVAAALQRLGGSLFGQVTDASGDNVAISPFSIGVALALVLNGARATSLDQLSALFGITDVDRLNGGLNALTTDVEALSGRPKNLYGKPAEVTVTSANALFGQAGLTWEPAFLAAMARDYGTGIRTVDYTSDADAVTDAINAWTADHTGGKITDIVPAGALDDRTRLVLVNTLYLKAPWDDPFTPDRPRTFTHLDGGTMRVPMMYTSCYHYVAGDGWAAVRIPYAGRRLAMTVVLPDEGRFTDVQADVAAGHLADYLGRASDEESHATYLPAWTFRTATSLAPALQALGVVAPFDQDQADLSGITQQEDLVLDDVVHQVFVAVDQDGTEAAAATAAFGNEATSGYSGPPPTPFVADRPFLFVIHDVEHGTPLFLGRVTDPTSDAG